MVKVTLAELEPGVTELADRLQVAFAGAPLQLSLTGLANEPPKGEIVSAYVAATPALTVALVGELVTLKSDPAPLNATVWTPGATLSLIVNVPARVPVTLGVKITLTVQLDPAARLVGQLLVWA